MKALNVVLGIIGWSLAAFVLWAIYPLLLKLLELGNRLHHLWL
jgi:hypothetical protein